MLVLEMFSLFPYQIKRQKGTLTKQSFNVNFLPNFFFFSTVKFVLLNMVYRLFKDSTSIQKEPFSHLCLFKALDLQIAVELSPSTVPYFFFHCTVHKAIAGKTYRPLSFFFFFQIKVFSSDMLYILLITI